MKFEETALPGAFIVSLEPHQDERGFFSRAWCRKEFTDHGLSSELVQVDISYNKRRGTLRGMHMQIAPSQEAKLVRVTQGRIFDVIIDARPDSPTFKQHFSVELNAVNRLALYIPPGLAHGFLTLVDDSEILYLMSDFYAPELQRNLRWNDPAFGIDWPFEPLHIKARDAENPDWRVFIEKDLGL